MDSAIITEQSNDTLIEMSNNVSQHTASLSPLHSGNVTNIMHYDNSMLNTSPIQQFSPKMYEPQDIQQVQLSPQHISSMGISSGLVSQQRQSQQQQQQHQQQQEQIQQQKSPDRSLSGSGFFYSAGGQLGQTSYTTNNSANTSSFNSDTTPAQQTTSELLSNLVKKRQLKNLRATAISRREPHNYDKSVPTQHQTNLYNQIMAQQNRNQQHLQQQHIAQMPNNVVISGTVPNTTYNSNSSLYMPSQTVHHQPMHQSPIQTTTNNYMNASNVLNLSATNNYVQGLGQTSIGGQGLMNMLPPSGMPAPHSQSSQSPKSSSNLLSLLSMKNTPVASLSSQENIDNMQQTDSFKATSSAHQNVAPYKPYPTQSSYKNSAYNQMSPRNMRLPSPPSNPPPLVSDRHNQLGPMSSTAAIDKELFRSKSLPLNSTLPLPIIKDETFVVPKYQATKSSSVRFRARSNSMVSKHHPHNSPAMQAAASEPMLKTLAQLLTSSSSGPNANQNPTCYVSPLTTKRS